MEIKTEQDFVNAIKRERTLRPIVILALENGIKGLYSLVREWEELNRQVKLYVYTKFVAEG